MAEVYDELARGAIGEEILDQVKLVLEVVTSQPTRAQFDELSEQVQKLQDDLSVVRTVVTTDARTLTDLEGRVLRLEDAA